MKERILIFGAGGHGKVVADMIRAMGHEVAGFVDQDGLGRQAEPGGGAIIALQDEILANGTVACATVAIGNNRVRLELVGRLEELGYDLPALIHPNTTVSPSARIGAGSHVLAGVVVNAAAQVGRGVILNTSAVIEHDCILHDGVHISPAAVLAGEVEVGPGAWIGAGAVIINRVKVGAGAIVGAGAVVIRDVPANTTVVGNPARITRTDG